MEQYYIVSGGKQAGPYDLVTLVKKIRNGTLSDEMLIRMEGDPEPREARDWPVLAGFLAEKKDDRRSIADNSQYRNLDLVKALQNGWRFVLQNTVACILSGIFVLISLFMLCFVYGVTSDSLHTAGYLACFVISYFLLCCYLMLILRMIRGQPVDFYSARKLLPAVKSLVPLSIIVSIPSLVGLLLLMIREMLANGPSFSDNGSIWAIAFAGLIVFVIPGLYTLTLYAFAPLLVIDQGYGFWEAMSLSRKAVLKRGLNESSVIYMLFLINFCAGMMALIPMVLTLPLTMSTLCEYYEEVFS